MDQISGVGQPSVPAKERQRNTRLFELSSNPARREDPKPIVKPIPEADEGDGR